MAMLIAVDFQSELVAVMLNTFTAGSNQRFREMVSNKHGTE